MTYKLSFCEILDNISINRIKSKISFPLTTKEIKCSKPHNSAFSNNNTRACKSYSLHVMNRKENFTKQITEAGSKGNKYFSAILGDEAIQEMPYKNTKTLADMD
jgi:hypothetical protein